MKALVFRPGATPVVEELVDFRAIRAAVGGYVEKITLDAAGGRALTLWLDEDGHPKGLAPNLYARGPLYTGALIVGTAVLTGMTTTRDGEAIFHDLTADEIRAWSAALRPETGGLQ